MANKLLSQFLFAQTKSNVSLAPMFCIQTRNTRYRERDQFPAKTIEELKSPLAEDDKRRYKKYKIRAAANDSTPHVFRDETIDKLINMIMMGGRKQLARRILSSVMEQMKRVQVKKYLETEDETVRATIECDPVVIIKAAIANASPVLHLIPLTRGGITYQVPVPITPKHAKFKSMKWFVRMCRDRKTIGRTHNLMSKEFLDAYNNEGRVIKAKLDLHRLCDQNRAYAYYRVMNA